MTTVPATDLARCTNEVLDALARGESVTIACNNTVLGTIRPAERAITLRGAFERVPKMPPDVADRYMADIRSGAFDDGSRNPRQK